MIYTGIGARKTNQDTLDFMINIAKILGKEGYTLRSGAAEGSDSAFEAGCDLVQGPKEIYLPWENFRKNNSKYTDPTDEAREISFEFAPYLRNAQHHSQCYMARNIHQVLGDDCNTPTDFVICWTPDGINNQKGVTRTTGGTGMAIRVASYYDIPIFNIKDPNQKNELLDFLSKHLTL